MALFEHDAARAILHYPEGQETSGYLASGRRHERLSDGDLARKWASAFRAWLDCRSFENDVRMDHLAAELHLRGRSLPTDLVPDELQELRNEFGDDPDNEPDDPDDW